MGGKERIVYPVACESVNKVSARQTDRKRGKKRETACLPAYPAQIWGEEEGGKLANHGEKSR